MDPATEEPMHIASLMAEMKELVDSTERGKWYKSD